MRGAIVIALLASPSPSRALRGFIETDPTWRKMNARSLDLAEKRGRLSPGSSRARVTTANARWSIAAEARDRAEIKLTTVFDSARKPWEMTRAEWTRAIEALQPDAAGSAARASWHPRNLLRVAFLRAYLPPRERFGVSGEAVDSVAPTHRDVIAQAIAEGHTVPAEVIAEYPELHCLAVAS